WPLPGRRPWWTLPERRRPRRRPASPPGGPAAAWRAQPQPRRALAEMAPPPTVRPAPLRPGAGFPRRGRLRAGADLGGTAREPGRAGGGSCRLAVASARGRPGVAAARAHPGGIRSLFLGADGGNPRPAAVGRAGRRRRRVARPG